MPTGFSRSLRALGADGFRPSLLGIACAGALLAGWTLWGLRGSTTLYEVSGNARLEIDRAAYSVESPLGGSVSSENLAIGREVKKGDLLVQLDSTAEKLQLQEAESRLDAGKHEISALQQQIGIEQQARKDEQQARKDEQQTAEVSIQEAQAKAREAVERAGHAAAEAQRFELLKAEKLAAGRDVAAAESEARRERAAVETARSEVERLQQDLKAKDSERGTRILKLATDLSRLEGQQEIVRSTVSRLRYEIERRSVRASTTGRIGETAILRNGTVVSGGEKLAAILPEGHLMVAALFSPAAIGRIRPGQKARVRLSGYPWIQYGALSATVARASSEVRDGAVRIELTIDAQPNVSIPLQHGLPGAVEVAVETISPARLVMRLAGRQLSGSQ